jgi:thiol-disulfide isomerase/thioredoxin
MMKLSAVHWFVVGGWYALMLRLSDAKGVATTAGPRPSLGGTRSGRATSLIVVLSLAAMSLLAGCERAANGPGSEKKPGDAATDAGADPAGASDVTLQIASWDEVQQAVASHKGKVVVLDVWNSTCAPCIKELPGLARLHQEMAGDVACLTLNLDYIGIANEPPETNRETATKILRDKQVACQNFLSSDPDEQVYKEIGAASVPVVLVYDREGKLAKRFDNEANEYGKEGFSYEQHITPFVKELTAEGS